MSHREELPEPEDRAGHREELPAAIDARMAAIYAWIDHGRSEGWCSSLFCEAHDAVLSEAEGEQFEEGWDPCLYSVRVWIEREA